MSKLSWSWYAQRSCISVREFLDSVDIAFKEHRWSIQAREKLIGEAVEKLRQDSAFLERLLERDIRADAA